MCAIDRNIGGTRKKTMYKTHANYKIDITTRTEIRSNGELHRW
jgi:hypothetical protein